MSFCTTLFHSRILVLVTSSRLVFLICANTQQRRVNIAPPTKTPRLQQRRVNIVPVLLPHGFQELNSIMRNPIVTKINFSPIKHPKVLWAILANSYSVKFAEELQDFSRDSRYPHTKSVERCKQRLKHISSGFCSPSRIKVTFIFDSKLITTTNYNREGNKSINVNEKKQRKTSGKSKRIPWCYANTTHLCYHELP